MIITFIRHSISKFDPNLKVTEWDLTDKGRELARELGQNPDIQAVEKFYSSDQKKAILTCELVNLGKKPHIIDPGLAELTSVTIQVLDDFEKEVGELYTGKVERLHGGESLKEGLERFEKALERIVTKEAGIKNLGIVSHGFVLSLFANKYAGIDLVEMHHKIEMPDHALFDWETKKFSKFYF